MDYQKLILPVRGRAVKAIYRENTIPGMASFTEEFVFRYGSFAKKVS